MSDHKLNGFLGAKDKSYNHGSNFSQIAKQNHIIDLEILAQHLQKRLRLYEDPMCMENLMEGIGKYKIKEEKDDFDEETLQPSQPQGFFEHKKAKGMYARYYDYHRKYDGNYWNDEYYERCGNYD